MNVEIILIKDFSLVMRFGVKILDRNKLKNK